MVLTLNYPGFEVNTLDCVWGGSAGCTPTVLHVQRWADKALTGDSESRGTARVYFTPNETPDSVTNVNLDTSDDDLILIQSQDREERKGGAGGWRVCVRGRTFSCSHSELNHATP